MSVTSAANALALNSVIAATINSITVISIKTASGEIFRKVSTEVELITSQKKQFTFWLNENEGNGAITWLSLYGNGATAMVDVALDGSLPWQFALGATGYKYVGIYDAVTFVPGLSVTNLIVTKFNGKILISSGAPTAGDFCYFTNNSGYRNLNLTIPSTDSGWGDSYTPSTAEIKAYFNGWTMYNLTAGANPDNPANNLYNGTGTKAWVRRSDGISRVWVDGTTVTPTAFATNYTPYHLRYVTSAGLGTEFVTQAVAITKDNTNSLTVVWTVEVTQ